MASHLEDPLKFVEIVVLSMPLTAPTSSGLRPADGAIVRDGSPAVHAAAAAGVPAGGAVPVSVPLAVWFSEAEGGWIGSLKSTGQEVKAWADEQVQMLIEAHPEMYRAIPAIGAACGRPQSELFGLALEDIDFSEQVLRVRRQVKKLRGGFVYALPKSDREHGMHALRHYYASMLLADGVSIKKLAAYLGHADPGFALRVYAHMLPGSYDRAIKAIDRRMGGAILTEQPIV